MQATLNRAKASLQNAAQTGLNGVTKLATKTEHAVTRIPAGVYIGFGLDCCIAATVLHIAGQRKAAHAVGSWAPVALLLGIYSKMEQKHSELH